jgi:Holliday junction resolvase RusA-like endonuclease
MGMSITKEQAEAMRARVYEKRIRESANNILHKYDEVFGSGAITFLVDPCPAPRQSRSDAWKPSPRVLRYRAWKDRMRPLCDTLGWKLGDSLRVDFHVQMPKSWSKKKRKEMLGEFHQQKPDIDNLCKALMDLQGVDDGHVHTIHATKRWSEVGKIVVTP